MRLTVKYLAASLTLLTSCALLSAQVRVHPFEQPPRLREATATPQALMALTGKVPFASPCNPKGSVSRTGTIVSVDLEYLLADFTINNPDPSSENGGDDPVSLRSYGGCKSGPVIDVLPGNTLRVDLKNDLSQNDPSCLANPPSGLNLNLAPGVSCFNTINLHTHGMHGVSGR
jgi:hypothetical protein